MPGCGYEEQSGAFTNRGMSKMECPQQVRRVRRSRWCNTDRKFSSFPAAVFRMDLEKFKTWPASEIRRLHRLIKRRRVRSLITSSPPLQSLAHCMAPSVPSLRAMETTSKAEVMVVLPRHNSAGNKEIVEPSQKMARRIGTFENDSPLHKSWMIFRNQVPWYLAQAVVPQFGQR